MYKKFNNKRFNNKKSFSGDKKRTTPDDFLVEDKRRDAGKPDPKQDTVDLAFQKKAFKDMTFGSYSVAVNPQGEISEEADPYAVVNRTNVVVDAAYAGNDNTSGSVIPQLANGTTSTFKDVTDIVKLDLVVNYAYCAYLNDDNESDNPHDPHADYKVNKFMLQPYNDILETIVGEAYTDLAFFKWNVDTNAETRTAPSGDGLLDLMLSYQAVVQQVLLVPQAYRTIRSLEQHLKDMCYMNGASKLNDMYGRLKKAAFVNAIKGVSEAMMYHYADTNWWKQVNMLVSVPCRKSNSMIDPLIVVQPKYRINEGLVVKNENGVTLFSTNDTMASIMNKCQDIIERMNPYTLVRMARTDNLSASDILEWFNGIADRCTELNNLLDQFTADFKEMIVALKRMAKVGITEWQYGQFIEVDKIDNKYEPKFNKLIYDIVRSIATGSSQIKYDLELNQWKVASLWDLFLGIPSYDYKSGGSVLTFSSHTIDKPIGTPSSIVYCALYYPATYQNTPDIGNSPYFMTCLTRSNFEYYVSSESFYLNSSKEMVRLMPLSSYSTTLFKAPVIQMKGKNYLHMTPTTVDFPTSGSGSQAQNVVSWALFTLAKLFGYCRQLQTRVGANSTYNDNIETDALCFVDTVIDDQSNAIQSFCRRHAPFRTVKADQIDKIGFAVANKSKK